MGEQQLRAFFQSQILEAHFDGEPSWLQCCYILVYDGLTNTLPHENIHRPLLKLWWRKHDSVGYMNLARCHLEHALG
jgi:hypothetical protein